MHPHFFNFGPGGIALGLTIRAQLFRLRPLLHGPVLGLTGGYEGTSTRLYGGTLPNCTEANPF